MCHHHQQKVIFLHDLKRYYCCCLQDNWVGVWRIASIHGINCRFEEAEIVDSYFVMILLKNKDQTWVHEVFHSYYHDCEHRAASCDWDHPPIKKFTK